MGVEMNFRIVVKCRNIMCGEAGKDVGTLYV